MFFKLCRNWTSYKFHTGTDILESLILEFLPELQQLMKKRDSDLFILVNSNKTRQNGFKFEEERLTLHLS